MKKVSDPNCGCWLWLDVSSLGFMWDPVKRVFFSEVIDNLAFASLTDFEDILRFDDFQIVWSRVQRWLCVLRLWFISGTTRLNVALNLELLMSSCTTVQTVSPLPLGLFISSMLFSAVVPASTGIIIIVIVTDLHRATNYTDRDQQCWIWVGYEINSKTRQKT